MSDYEIAYSEGYDAYLNEWVLEDNPYEHGEYWEGWYDGWYIENRTKS